MIVHVCFVKLSCIPCVSGLVKYKVSVQGAATATLKVTLMDKNRRCVASSNEPSGVLKVVDVNLWWPYLMHENPGYLYSMEVRRHVYTHGEEAFCVKFQIQVTCALPLNL